MPRNPPKPLDGRNEPAAAATAAAAPPAAAVPVRGALLVQVRRHGPHMLASAGDKRHKRHGTRYSAVFAYTFSLEYKEL